MAVSGNFQPRMWVVPPDVLWGPRLKKKKTKQMKKPNETKQNKNKNGDRELSIIHISFYFLTVGTVVTSHFMLPPWQTAASNISINKSFLPCVASCQHFVPESRKVTNENVSFSFLRLGFRMWPTQASNSSLVTVFCISGVRHHFVLFVCAY